MICFVPTTAYSNLSNRWHLYACRLNPSNGIYGKFKICGFWSVERYSTSSQLWFAYSNDPRPDHTASAQKAFDTCTFLHQFIRIR
jgi:hypothetical protein